MWAGRCSSVVRSFLKQHGKELNRVAYVLTRGSEHKSEDIYRQMDLYTAKPHQAATSLRVGHVGHTFWQEEFLRQIRETAGRRRNSDTPFQISTFEKGAGSHAGKIKGSGPPV